MISNKIVVFDYETDEADAQTCNPVEIAAVVIDPWELQIIPNSWFHSGMRPPSIDDKDYVEKHRKTIQWHANNRNPAVSMFEVLEEWKEYPPEKSIFLSFVEYLKKWNNGSGGYTAPIPAGMNISSFDLVIFNRLSNKYGVKSDSLFNTFRNYDVLDCCKYWFDFLPKKKTPQNYKMDTLREFFGMETDGAHGAKFDVKQEAQLLLKFLRLFKRQANRVKWREK